LRRIFDLLAALAGLGLSALAFGAYGGSPPKRGRHLCNKTEET
jgi:hypothetical protein